MPNDKGLTIYQSYIRINLRNEPRLSAKVVATAPIRTYMISDFEEDGWLHIMELNGSPFRGYVKKHFTVEVA